MTTTARRPRARAAVPTRRAESVGGWRVALRMAWRDIRAAKARSALVVALIGLPVLMLVAGLVVAMTADRSEVERLPETLGSMPASIDSLESSAVEQYRNGRGTTGAATPLPTPLEPGAPAVALAKAAAPLLPGAHLVPTATAPVSLQASTIVTGTALRIDAADAARPAHAPRTSLVSGRYAQTPTEVAVTRLGVAQGLPTSGQIPMGVQGGARTPVTIVGVVESATNASVVIPMTTDAVGTVLVDRPGPVTWDDVRRLNRYGLVVTSRAVETNPPAEYLAGYSTSTEVAAETAVYGSLLAGLLLEMCLLAGPAFAIGAQRQRRALALAASNGATRAQLRTVVLAQALVLGVLTAAVATAAGVGLGIGAVRALDRWWPQLGIRGAADIPWGYVLAITAAAGLACVLAALVPARGLGRLDVVSVLRGQSVSPRPHPGLPGLGVGLACLGGVLVVWPIITRSGSTPAGTSIVVGSFLLVIGAILTIPVILSALGRLTSRLPISGRMATRDATRQRGRAVPTAASLIGGAALLAALGTAVMSASAADRRDYTPALPSGWAIVEGTMPDGPWDEVTRQRNGATTAAVVRQTLPQVRLHEQRYVTDTPRGIDSGDSMTQFAILAPGCTTAQARAAVAGREDLGSDCVVVASDGAFATITDGAAPPQMLVLDADAAAALYGLDPSAVDALRRGELLAAAPSGRTRWVRLTSTGLSNDTATTTVADGGELTVHAVPSLGRSGRYSNAGPATLITPEGARRLGWPSHVEARLAERPGGFTPAEQDAVEQAVSEAGTGDVYVERGYRSQLTPFVVAIFVTVGLLSVVAVVVATALSVRESRRDLDTLAAVGASRGIRRRFAAWQAGSLAAIGTLLGYAIGLVPGIALCWPITASPRPVDPAGYDGPWWTPAVIIDIPWAALGLTLLGVVALSALVAAALAGRDGQITRRLA